MIQNLKSFRWWGARITEATVAFLLFYVTASLLEYREAMKRVDTPAEEWFVLTEIFVPNHTVGSDPEILYDREILIDHRGFWVAEVQRVDPDGRDGVFQNACIGSGVADYDRDEVLSPNKSVKWSWFFGRPCVVPPGQYRVQLTRDMVVPGWPVKKTRAWSNTFIVSR